MIKIYALPKNKEKENPETKTHGQSCQFKTYYGTFASINNTRETMYMYTGIIVENRATNNNYNISPSLKIISFAFDDNFILVISIEPLILLICVCCKCFNLGQTNVMINCINLPNSVVSAKYIVLTKTSLVSLFYKLQMIMYIW